MDLVPREQSLRTVRFLPQSLVVDRLRREGLPLQVRRLLLLLLQKPFYFYLLYSIANRMDRS